jgi:hypothetical protein
MVMVIVIIIKVERCASAAVGRCDSEAGEIDYMVATATTVRYATARYAIATCDSDQKR